MDTSPILDIGCGRGDAAIFMAKLSRGTVVAIDINAINKRGYVNFVVADANHLPFRGNLFNLVIMYSLLECVAEPKNVIKETSRILKKKGIVIVQLPNLHWLIEPHTKWPLLGLMPHSIRETIRRAIGYSYINSSITVKKIVKAFKAAGLILVARKTSGAG